MNAEGTVERLRRERSISSCRRGHHRHRGRLDRRACRPAGRARRARRSRRLDVERILEAHPRRPALPAHGRRQARARGAHRAPRARARGRAAPRAPAPLRDAARADGPYGPVVIGAGMVAYGALSGFRDGPTLVVAPTRAHALPRRSRRTACVPAACTTTIRPTTRGSWSPSPALRPRAARPSPPAPRSSGSTCTRGARAASTCARRRARRSPSAPAPWSTRPARGSTRCAGSRTLARAPASSSPRAPTSCSRPTSGGPRPSRAARSRARVVRAAVQRHARARHDGRAVRGRSALVARTTRIRSASWPRRGAPCAPTSPTLPACATASPGCARCRSGSRRDRVDEARDGALARAGRDALRRRRQVHDVPPHRDRGRAGAGPRARAARARRAPGSALGRGRPAADRDDAARAALRSRRGALGTPRAPIRRGRPGPRQLASTIADLLEPLHPDGPDIGAQVVGATRSGPRRSTTWCEGAPRSSSAGTTARTCAPVSPRCSAPAAAGRTRRGVAALAIVLG